MAKTQKDIIKDMDKLVRKRLNMKFSRAVEEIKQAIIAEYDEELVDVVTDRNSKTNPNLYRDEFIDRLNSFSYIEDSGDTMSINVPSMETFDFSGRMKVLETIMTGLAGIYVEINEEDYITIFNKRPINEDPLDEYISSKDRIYLVRRTAKIRRAENELNKKFVRYPFSNTPPIRILEEGEKFVEENIGRWIEEALEEAQKEFVRTYKGARV